MPMLKGLGNVLEKYRCEDISMDHAFNLGYKKRGRPNASLSERLHEETNASLVKYFLSKGGTLEDAIGKVNTFRTRIHDHVRPIKSEDDYTEPRKSSESAIRRHFLKYSKLFKSK